FHELLRQNGVRVHIDSIKRRRYCPKLLEWFHGLSTPYLGSGYINEMSCQGRRRCRDRAHEVSSATLPLTPLEIAHGRRCTTLPRKQPVLVHSQAHRTTGLAPFKPSVDEYPVQALGFSHGFDLS